MKKILSILLTLVSVSCFSQTPFVRTSPSILAMDYHEKGIRSLISPVVADTADYVGVDSLGALLYEISTKTYYYRDTNLVDGTHKWTAFGSGGGGGVNDKFGHVDEDTLFDGDRRVSFNGGNMLLDHINQYDLYGADTAAGFAGEPGVGNITHQQFTYTGTQTKSNYYHLHHYSAGVDTTFANRLSEEDISPGYFQSKSEVDIGDTTYAYSEVLEWGFDTSANSNFVSIQSGNETYSNDNSVDTAHYNEIKVAPEGIYLYNYDGNTVNVWDTNHFVNPDTSVYFLQTDESGKLRMKQVTGGAGSGQRFGIEDSLGIQNRLNNFEGFNLELDSLGSIGLYSGDIDFVGAATSIDQNPFSVTIAGQSEGGKVASVTASSANLAQIAYEDNILGTRSFTTYYPDSIAYYCDTVGFGHVIVQTPRYISLIATSNSLINAAKLYVPLVSDSLDVSSPTKIAVWDNDTLKSADASAFGGSQRFGVSGEDDVAAQNRSFDATGFTFGIQGLASATSSNILYYNAITGEITQGAGAGVTVTASNGTHIDGGSGDVFLGSDLSENTRIGGAAGTYDLTIDSLDNFTLSGDNTVYLEFNDGTNTSATILENTDAFLTSALNDNSKGAYLLVAESAPATEFYTWEGSSSPDHVTIQFGPNTGSTDVDVFNLYTQDADGTEVQFTQTQNSVSFWTGATGTFLVKDAASGGTTHASAVFELESTTKGFLPPRMTTTQRNAISSPATGLTIYCSDCTATDASTGVTQTWNGAAWKNYW